MQLSLPRSHAFCQRLLNRLWSRSGSCTASHELRGCILYSRVETALPGHWLMLLAGWVRARRVPRRASASAQSGWTQLSVAVWNFVVFVATQATKHSLKVLANRSYTSRQIVNCTSQNCTTGSGPVSKFSAKSISAPTPLIHCASKTTTTVLLNTSVKNQPILIIFDTQNYALESAYLPPRL